MNGKSLVWRGCAKALLLFVAVFVLGQQAFARVLIANSVPNLTTQDVLTVPAGKKFTLQSVVIANDNSGSVGDQRIFKNGTTDLTGFITVAAGSSIQITFPTPIIFEGGEVFQVRNGASTGPTQFTLIGK